MWRHIRLSWHRMWNRVSKVTPIDEQRLLIVCTCGGYAQICAYIDGTILIERATCPVWIALPTLTIPRAHLVG